MSSCSFFFKIVCETCEKKRKKSLIFSSLFTCEKRFFSISLSICEKRNYFFEFPFPHVKRKEIIFSFFFSTITLHIQNLNKILIDIKRSKISIFDEKSQFCMFDIKIINFVCDRTDWHFDSFKIIKIIEWKDCRNMTIAKTFMKICIYYRIWMKNYALIVEFIYRLLRKNESFVWNNEQKKIIYFFKMILIRVSTLQTIDYFENVDDIIFIVNISNVE